MISYMPKYEKLLETLSSTSGAVVAFSGGVDSALLLKAAKDALGKNILALTGCLDLAPSDNLKKAREIAKSLDIEHLVIDAGQLENKYFLNNTNKRCYFCKQMLFNKMRRVADKKGFCVLLDGTNADDEAEFRPGRLAAKELGVRSPLVEAGLKKNEIGEILKGLGLPDWNRPSDTCLATRIPYGEKITTSKLKKIDEAELLLKSFGFKNIRVRLHGEHAARIEAQGSDIPLFFEAKTRNLILDEFRKIGFIYTAVDLGGYRPAVPTVRQAVPASGTEIRTDR